MYWSRGSSILHQMIVNFTDQISLTSFDLNKKLPSSFKNSLHTAYITKYSKAGELLI